jgi:hypothetical protein
VDFMFVWTPILCCGLFVNCVFNISVLWILYEFSVIFCIFFKKICSKIDNFRRPPLTAENSKYYFSAPVYFRRLSKGHRKLIVIFGGWLVAAENMALFLAIFFW